MDFKLLAPLLVTTIVALVGWFLVHMLNSKRDRKNKHRELRLEFLISAYTKIEKSAGRKLTKGSPEASGLEEAMAQIQLFGTQKQIDVLLANFKRDGDLNPILNLLRNELREEMNLPSIKGEIMWLRH